MISDNRSAFPVGEGDGSPLVCVCVLSCVCSCVWHETLQHFETDLEVACVP